MSPQKILARLFFACAALVAFGDGVRAQEMSALQSAASVVKERAYVSVDPAPRGAEFQIAVVVNIQNGYHMNSHKPLDAYLIPTTLTPQLPPGIRLVEAMYPSGQVRKFSFSQDKGLDVYSGSVTLRLRLIADDGARLGATTIPMSLRYQACNDSACLPPVRVPVTVQMQVAAAGTAGHPMHPEIFSADAPQVR